MKNSEEEEQQARLERARAIGLFRYMLIREAADPALSSRQRGAMVRELAGREHAGPSGQPMRVTRWTLDKWIRLWRSGGFDALVPHPRQSQPRTPPEVIELAAALKKENPARTAAQVQRILKAQSGWAPDERTIQRMFNRTGLRTLAPAEAAPAFGRFEASRPNEIWTGDALHAIRGWPTRRQASGESASRLWLVSYLEVQITHLMPGPRLCRRSPGMPWRPGPGPKRSTVRKLASPVERGAADDELLG